MHDPILRIKYAATTNNERARQREQLLIESHLVFVVLVDIVG
jgi:hypothetical protein